MKKKVTLIILAAIVLICAIVGGVWGFRYLFAETGGKITAQEEIQSAEFRIFSYDHFFNLCAEIQSQQALYDSQYELLQLREQGTDTYDKQLTVLSVIKPHIASLIYQYNADADKEYTRGQFRASCLPERISTESHEYGRRVSCDCE